MVSRSKELKSRMKSGASASTQRSASRPMVGSASMGMRTGSSHLCSRHLPTLSEAHSVSALANRPAGRCGLGAGTPAVAARAAVASLRALWVRAAGPRLVRWLCAHEQGVHMSRPWPRGVLRARGQRRAGSIAGAMPHVRVAGRRPAGAARQREQHEHGGCLRGK